MAYLIALIMVIALITISSTQACSPLYSQCGGKDWKGSTNCCSGSKCEYQNEWYFQCLPGNGGSEIINPPTAVVNSSPANGKTTRYWDCCKASCAWAGKASVSNPVHTCQANGFTSVGVNDQSSCNGGDAYMCNNQQPWAVNDNLAYGFAAAYLTGQSESSWCCACYSLVFTSDPVNGKELIVQVTNTGGDLGENHFDLQIPGGGVGIFNGCSKQFGTSSDGWGDRYGGVHQRSDCAQLPQQLRSGCEWRFDWFKSADNPTMTLKRVPCPKEIIEKTQCKRQDE